MDSNIKPNNDVQVYIALGYSNDLIKKFASWLNKKKHYLVVLDTKIPPDDQKKLPNLFVEEINKLNIVNKLSELAWRFVFLNIKLIVLDSFKEEELKNLVKDRWQEIKTGTHLSASAFANFQLPDLVSAMNNIHEEIKFASLENLRGCLRKVPAIICGAGPSLDESFFKIKEEKALVFSGGSALNALSHPPHFIGLTDSQTPPGFFKKSFEESILFFSLKAPYEILKKTFKQKFLCLSKERYLFFRWIVEKIGVSFDSIDKGWSTVTFLTSLAVYFGCDPIIFNGVDLSFKSKKIYADNVAKISYRKKQDKEFITAKGKNGDVVKTQNDWLMSAFFLQELTDANPSITFYSTSQEGLLLGKNVKPFEIKQLDCLESINIKEKLKHFESRPCFSLKKEINSQILDLINAEEKIVESNLVELERVFNGEIKELEPKESSWCEENVLKILWDIFKLVILRDEKRDKDFSFKERVHQMLFYKDVLAKHKSQLKKYLNV